MQAIAAFVLRGRNQAILSVIGFATLALVFTPFGLFSAASIGLVTLVHGPRQGLTITAIASVFILVISSFTGQIILGTEYVVFYWLPVWFLAQLLSKNYSLTLVVIVSSVIGMIVAVVMASLYVTYEVEWNKIIFDIFSTAFEQAKVDMAKDDKTVLLQNIGRWIVHFGAAYWVLSMCASLFIARWWQSLLYHPGGFGEEYRQLRLGIIFAVVGMIFIALAMVVKDGMLGHIFIGVASVIALAFLFQGLAIAHYFAAVRKLKGIWLYMLYVMMLVLMPYEFILIVLIGLSDNWVNYRARIKPL